MNINELEISIDPMDCTGRVIVFDTETTGLRANPDHILSIAALEIVDGKLSGKQFECYIRPRVQISKNASNVHGLRDSFYKEYFDDCYKDDKHKLESFLKFVEDSKLIAYNAQFDYTFLNYELSFWGMNEIPKSNFICCMRMFRAVMSRKDSSIKGNTSLKKSSEYFGIKALKEDFHSALFDAFTCARILIKLINVNLKQQVIQANEAGHPNINNEHRKAPTTTPTPTHQKPNQIETQKFKKKEPKSEVVSEEIANADSNFIFGEMKSVMNNLLNLASSYDAGNAAGNTTINKKSNYNC